MKNIRNTRDGYHLNSKYWQEWKQTLPEIIPSSILFQALIGIILSDATMYYTSREALVKFEQGVSQKEFIDHLFSIFKVYCFIIEPGKRYHIRGPKEGEIKSYWFKTFSHSSFTKIWDIFYTDNKKSMKKPQIILIVNALTEVGLSY